MKLFPESAYIQLEFDKVKALLAEHCRSEYAIKKANLLGIHTRIESIETELRQSYEYKQLLQNSIYFPNDPVFNLSKELKMLSIPGAVLAGDELIEIRKLAELMKNIFRWFDAERRNVYNGLVKVIDGTYYEKVIVEMIDEIIDESGQVKDNASDELRSIRMNLYRKRNELRKAFDRIISKLNKQGYLADIEESFLNGRRVVAVFAEQKRTVKGILHGESESRRTTFIEPEETIELNNEVFSLENEERREVQRILKQLTSRLGIYSSLLKAYLDIVGEFDFIKAKARLAVDMNSELPNV